jgi:hypothetical protein
MSTSTISSSTTSSSSSSSAWALPISYIACMIGFTVLRKLGGGKLLKPHQRSIAIGVALTVMLTSASILGYLDEGFEASGHVNHALFVLLPQAACYFAALALRKETDVAIAGWSFMGVVAMVAAQTFMCGYLSLLVGISGATIGVMLKGRVGHLVMSYGVLSLIVTAFCLLSDTDEAKSATSPWVFVIVEVETLLIVKLTNPSIDGDNSNGDGSSSTGNSSNNAGGDVEMDSGKWSW